MFFSLFFSLIRVSVPTHTSPREWIRHSVIQGLNSGESSWGRRGLSWVWVVPEGIYSLDLYVPETLLSSNLLSCSRGVSQTQRSELRKWSTDDVRDVTRVLFPDPSSDWVWDGCRPVSDYPLSLCISYPLSCHTLYVITFIHVCVQLLIFLIFTCFLNLSLRRFLLCVHRLFV